jgi:membrane protein
VYESGNTEVAVMEVDDVQHDLLGAAPGDPGWMRPLVRLSKRDDLRGRMAQRAASSFVVACLLRYLSISGRDRILVLAGQAFTAVIPLFIIVAAVAPNDGAAGQGIITRFHLTGSAAASVRTLFTRPPDAGGAITLTGAVVLFFSTLSYTKSLQRTYEAAWGLPSTGWRGTVHGLGGVALMLGEIIGLAVLAGLLRRLPTGGALAFLLPAPFAVALWLQLQRLLLSGRVTRRQLLPGALTAGAGQVVVSVYSAIWMPHLISENAARYGVIGVTFALLTWLIVVSAAIVVAAVVSAEAGQRQGVIVLERAPKKRSHPSRGT